MLKQIQGKKISTKSLNRICMKYNIKFDKLKQEEIYKILQKEYKKYKKLKPKAEERRKKFLWKLAEEKEDNKKLNINTLNK